MRNNEKNFKIYENDNKSIIYLKVIFAFSSKFKRIKQNDENLNEKRYYWFFTLNFKQ